jgi:TolB-like protein/DNA-binding winged helix-turn-helix (wHTH) protein/lipopolysaccharide biosynthesis regulator YciM
LGTGELRKSGKPINLPPQPAKVLALLATHPGELLTREQIQQEIWGSDTFVDFEKGLNFAIKKIREALGDDAGSPRYIETVHRRGYRFAAPVEQVAVPDASIGRSFLSEASPHSQASLLTHAAHPKMPATGETRIGTSPIVQRSDLSQSHAGLARVLPISKTETQAEDTLESRPPRTAKPRRLIWAFLFAAIVIVGSAAIWLIKSRTTQLPKGRVVLIVLPFDNWTGSPDQESFSDGITEELSTQFTRLEPKRLGVIGRVTAMTYKNSHKSIRQIGKETGAQLVLEGSVRGDAGNIRISAQLILVEGEVHVWAKDYDRSLQGALAMQREVAIAIAKEIQVTLGSEQQSNLARKHPRESEAYDAYLSGRYLLKKRTHKSISKAIEYFQQALEKDPGYAAAYAGLADSYNLLAVYGYSRADEAYPMAKAEALQALRLDDTLAEAYTTLADVKINYDWDWRGAKDDFEHAIRLDPNYDTAHLWYGEDYLSRLGRHEKAIAEVRRAQQIDPLSPIIGSILSEIFYFARQYDPAIKEAKKTLDLDPDYVPALERLGWAYEQKRMYPEAIEVFEHWRKMSRDDPEMKAQLAHAYALSGRTNEALKLLAELQDESRPEHVSPYFVAVVYTALGENKQALDWLEKSYRAHEMPPIKVEPRFDNLQSEPRFHELLRRMGYLDESR